MKSRSRSVGWGARDGGADSASVPRSVLANRKQAAAALEGSSALEAARALLEAPAVTELRDFSDVEEPTLEELRWFHGNGAPALPLATESGWIPRTLSSVADEPPRAPELGGLGILYPGKRHVFSGPQESAKTLAAYVCGLHVIRAGDSVVLVDFEMGEYDAKRRFRELGATDEELEQIAYVEPQSPATPIAIERLIQGAPGLVIIDAAAGAFQVDGLDDNSRRDVEVWAQSWVNPFWRAQIATLVLDHVTKNAETRGNYAIGSERKVGGVDVHIGFSVIEPIKRGGHGRYKVVTHKDRGGFLKRGKLAEFALRSDPETHALQAVFEPFTETDEEHPWRPTVYMERVSRYLELCYEPVSKNRIEHGVKGKAETIREAVSVLEREGWIEISDAGVESIRPFREEEDRFVPTSSRFVPETGDSYLVPSSLPLGGDGGGREDRKDGDEVGTSSSSGTSPDIEF